MSTLQPHIETFKRGGTTWGRLLEDFTYKTPITGYDKEIKLRNFHCKLTKDGTLKVFCLSEWDFGSFAIDTPAMVYASLAHDAFCHMTNWLLLPWEVRFQADKYFWQCLTEAGATTSRWWRVPGVMLYSQFVARWKDRK